MRACVHACVSSVHVHMLLHVTACTCTLYCVVFELLSLECHIVIIISICRYLCTCNCINLNFCAFDVHFLLCRDNVNWRERKRAWQ